MVYSQIVYAYRLLCDTIFRWQGYLLLGPYCVSTYVCRCMNFSGNYICIMPKAVSCKISKIFFFFFFTFRYPSCLLSTFSGFKIKKYSAWCMREEEVSLQ